MVTPDAELTRLTTALTEVQAAIKAIVTQNATQIEFDGRSITRPQIEVLREEEDRLRELVNIKRMEAVGGDYVFGRYVEYT